MVIDLLTKEDKDKIESYISCYTPTNHHLNRAPIDYILRCWNEAKSKYLETLFKDQLIITKPIVFEEDSHELYVKMSELITQDNRIRAFLQKITNIYDFRGYSWDSPETKTRHFVNSLCSPETLSANKIKEHYFDCDKNYFDLKIKENFIRIQKNMKPIRIITKIANAYDIGLEPDENGVNDLEYFRRKHSLALNQKALKGNLCLSIHPLDYMTMSDNAEGWDSCMSWENDGEYKQGTVEMMNSPCVVVAYLASDSRTFDWWGSENNSWNSKKWRSLFIVDKDFIVNVRSYPYHNDNLVKSVIKELSKLSGWGEIEPEKYLYLENWEEHRKDCIPVTIGNRSVALDFCTQTMYNDFGHDHFIVLNPNETKEIDNQEYNYSGYSECMFCGETNETTDIGMSNGEKFLTCRRCFPHYECDWCGEEFDNDDFYTTGEGYRVCDYCWRESTEIDPIDQTTYMRDNMYEILLAKTNDLNSITTREDTCDYKGIFVYENNVGSSKWNNCFNISKYHKVEVAGLYWTDEVYIILPCECTDKGLAAFEIYSEEDLKDYLS